MHTLKWQYMGDLLHTVVQCATADLSGLPRDLLPRRNNGCSSMDITTVSCDTSTRQALREYVEEHGHANYDEALRAMLTEVSADA